MASSLKDALEIVKHVTDMANDVCFNKHQCTRLAERFGEIGKALRQQDNIVHPVDVSDTNLLGSLEFDHVLALLRKGEALVASYRDGRTAIPTILGRVDNPEAFKEMHDEIDSLKAYLYLDNDVILTSIPEQSTSESWEEQKDALLSHDSERDREEMLSKLQNLKLQQNQNDRIPSELGMVAADHHVAVELEQVIKDKCKFNSTNSDTPLILPSYLSVKFSTVSVDEAPIKPLPSGSKKSRKDDHLEGKAAVHRGKWLGCDCAVKTFKSSDHHWNKMELQKEVTSLMKLKHPHITQLIGFAKDKEKTYVLYEKMDGDLRQYMECRRSRSMFRRPFNRTEEVNIITQIARGMFYLHRQGYVHGELKCTNVLIKEVVNAGHVDVKISDFHCSRELGVEPITTDSAWKHRSRWSPPEAIIDGKNLASDDQLQKADVYSFGMTCYEVVTGNLPFQDIRGDRLEKMILAGERPPLPADLSEELKLLIQKCWHPKPHERPTFEGLCYVLNMNPPNMTYIQRLRQAFCGGDPVEADDLMEEDWTALLKLQRQNPKFPRPEEQVNKETDAADADLPKCLMIDPWHLQPVRPLGKGASAEVYEVAWIGCRFAVKWLKSDHASKLRREVNLLQKLLHPHVVRLVGFSVIMSSRCGIVMEVMDQTLRAYVDSRFAAKSPLPQSEVLAILTKVAMGMEYLHSRGVTHGDLKGANVLVRNTKAGRNMDIKIVDFGLSQILDQEPTSRRSGTGTGWWRAPEVVSNLDLNHVDLMAADVYSFGMMCYEVVTGMSPYSNMSYELAETLVLNGRHPDFKNVKMVDGLKALLDKCYSLEPRNRPTFSEIREQLASFSPQH
jgi:serine/threonine protein kinase